MKQERSQDGKFAAKPETRVTKSFRCSPYLAEKLKNLPKTNDFIESAIMQAIAAHQIPPDLTWDYYIQWEALHQLIFVAGNAIAILSQHEEQSEIADAELQVVKRKIEEWLKNMP